MLGVCKELFDCHIEEMTRLYLNAKETPFAVPSPVIVDIDCGKVMQIEKYYALVHLESLISVVNSSKDLINNNDAELQKCINDAQFQL